MLKEHFTQDAQLIQRSSSLVMIFHFHGILSSTWSNKDTFQILYVMLSISVTLCSVVMLDDNSVRTGYPFKQIWALTSQGPW